MKLTYFYEHLISKGGHILEILPKIQSGYVSTKEELSVIGIHNLREDTVSNTSQIQILRDTNLMFAITTVFQQGVGNFLKMKA